MEILYKYYFIFQIIVVDSVRGHKKPNFEFTKSQKKIVKTEEVLIRKTKLVRVSVHDQSSGNRKHFKGGYVIVPSSL